MAIEVETSLRSDRLVRLFEQLKVEDRPHDALSGLPPADYAQRNLENSTLELST